MGKYIIQAECSGDRIKEQIEASDDKTAKYMFSLLYPSYKIKSISEKRKITIKQARSDLKYLYDSYGPANDYCGSFCNCDVLWDVIMGKETIYNTIIQNIRYYFTNGIEDSSACCYSRIKPDKNDKRIISIIERYDIEE